MERIAFLLFDLIICVVEGYLYYSFWLCFLQRRFCLIWSDIGIMSVGMLLLFCINHYQQSALNLVASCIVSISLCVIIFQGKPRKKLYIWFTSWFIMACSEFVVAGILRLTWGRNAIIVSSSPAIVILSTIMMKITTLFIYKVICNKTSREQKSYYPAIASLFYLLPVSSFILYIALCYMEDGINVIHSDNLFLLSGCVLLLISNVVAFIICDRLILEMNKVREFEIMETKRHLEEVHYKSVNEMNENVKTIVHSMNGVVRTLDVLLNNRETDQIKHVILGLHEKLCEASQKIYCGNPLIDAILSEKAKTASAQNITYHVFVEPGFAMIEMKPIDLISLISNLIDNAIEASSKCRSGYVDIKMFCANEGQIVILKFKNNYVEKPDECETGFRTRKNNPSMHGIGLKQVQQLVKQYNGYLNIEYDKNIFEVTISFFAD